jgi:hypothetical protein
MKRPEDAIQRAVFQHIAARAPDNVFVWHTPNGGKRSPIEAAIFKSLGVKAGVPDVCAIRGGRFYGLELKAPKGRLSPSQVLTLEHIETAGGICEVTYSLDAALACLEGWGLLRGEAR